MTNRSESRQSWFWWGPYGGAVLLAALLGLLLGGLALTLKELPSGNSVDPKTGLPILLISGTSALLVALLIIVAIYKNIGLADKSMALGLPEGSVRAIIALLLILLFFIASVFLYSDARRPEVATLESLTSAQMEATFGADLTQIDTMTADFVDHDGNSETPAQERFTVGSFVKAEASEDLAKQLLTTTSTLVVAIAAFHFGAKSVQAATSGNAAPAATDLVTLATDALKGPGFDDVVVSVAGSTLILYGTVADEKMRHAAEQAARGVGGVAHVSNLLVVGEPEPTVSLKDLVSAAAKKAGGDDVEVTVADGVATLFGTVTDQAVRDAVVGAVGDVEGINEINDDALQTENEPNG